jgi:hypothetical protein
MRKNTSASGCSCLAANHWAMAGLAPSDVKAGLALSDVKLGLAPVGVGAA